MPIWTLSCAISVLGHRAGLLQPADDVEGPEGDAGRKGGDARVKIKFPTREMS